MMDIPLALNFDDVLIVPQWSSIYSRADVILEREYKFYHSNCEWKGFPLIISNMGCTGTINMAKVAMIHKVITCLHKFHTVENILNFWTESTPTSNIKDYVWISVGIREQDKIFLRHLIKRFNEYCYHLPNLCIDVANGHNSQFAKIVAEYRDMFPQSIIMAGNVATPDAAMRLIEIGKADIAKIGIGPGSACLTRTITGVGYPQLTAASLSAHAVHGMKSADKRMGLICSDGGCKTIGDIAKAFACGSDFVMCGGMFAGYEECDGEWIYNPDKDDYTLKFYGMSSEYAQQRHYGETRDYRASEGDVILVPYKGSVETLINEIRGGIRSTCSYVGATCLKDLPKCTQFIRVNSIK